MTKDSKRIPVLIAGGGPVGLALAVELGTRGVRCMLVDARDGSVAVPKMSQVSARSMEFCRRWGIVDEIEQSGWPNHYPQDFVYVTSLTGYELARSRWAPYDTGPDRHVTPNGNIQCPQIFFDPILRRRAASLPTVDLRYHVRLDSVTDEGDRVRARVTDLAAGREEEIVADYVVGCDGADSMVRNALGISMLGAGRLSYSVSVYFRAADLIKVHDKGWARFYRFIDETGHWADLVAIDGAALWRLTLLGLDRPADRATTDVEAIFRRAVGAPFPYEVISILPWERRDLVAAHFGRGRVFIAGDAAHQLSPTGGLGMNTGVCSAADLGWKLAAVLAGWGGSHLLESYEIERRPVAQSAVDESTAYYRRTRIFPTGKRVDENSPEGEAVRRKFADDFARLEREGTLYISEHIKLGYTYDASPICVPDGSKPLAPNGIDYVPNARPGARAPHLWLGEGRSILDLFGDGFVLLRLGDRPPVADALVDAARKRNVPLAVHDIARPDALALYERALVLVRPDGHVAWRGDALPDDPAALIDRVRGATRVAVTASPG